MYRYNLFEGATYCEMSRIVDAVDNFRNLWNTQRKDTLEVIFNELKDTVVHKEVKILGITLHKHRSMYDNYLIETDWLRGDSNFRTYMTEVCGVSESFVDFCYKLDCSEDTFDSLDGLSKGTGHAYLTSSQMRFVVEYETKEGYNL